MRMGPSGPGNARSSMPPIATFLSEKLINFRNVCRRLFTVIDDASAAPVIANMFKSRLACGSRGMLNPGALNASQILTERQSTPNGGRPFLDIQAVSRKKRESEAVHAKRDAAGMRDRAGFVLDTPGRPEMVEMVIEADTGGRLLGRAHRDQQFEFQRLLELTDRHYLTCPTEERIARGRDLVREPQLISQLLSALDPALSELGDLPGGGDADIFAHAERLQAIEIPGGFAPEAIASNIESQPADRHRTTARHQRVNRVTSGRRKDQIGRCQRSGPIATRLELVGGRTYFGFRPVQGADTAEQIGEALQVP